MSLFWEKHINSDIEVFGFRKQRYHGLALFFYLFKIIRKYNPPNWRIIKHAKELLQLEKEGLLDAYHQFLVRYNAFSNMAAAQNFYYFQFIKDRFSEKDDLNFLEIGAGGGIFLMLCFEHLPVKNYTIIDLPEMLEIAKKNIATHRPDIMQYVAFLTPGQKSEMNYNAFFNFNSFSEMEEAEIRKYFSLIYSAAKPQALFFNVNYHRKIKNKDGSVSDNNPLLFPYRDKAVVWEIDKIFRSKKPLGSPAYIRIEVIT